MEAYLMSLGVDVWSSILIDYDVVDVPPTDADGKKLYGNNSKSKNTIFFGLSEPEVVKVMHCKYVKELWVKLNQIHEGDEKFNQDKLQTFRMRFESLIISEDEIIAKYFLRVNEVTNMIRGLGEEVKEEMIVQKLLRSLPMRFNAKISAIEEMVNLKDLKMDQLHGTLTIYEVRVGIENYEPMEATLKVFEKHNQKKDHQYFSSHESNHNFAQLAKQ